MPRALLPFFFFLLLLPTAASAQFDDGDWFGATCTFAVPIPVPLASARLADGIAAGPVLLLGGQEGSPLHEDPRGQLGGPCVEDWDLPSFDAYEAAPSVFPVATPIGPSWLALVRHGDVVGFVGPGFAPGFCDPEEMYVWWFDG